MPVEAQITAFAPSSSAFDTASTIPLSLNEPVGFRPSYFPNSPTPSSRLKFRSGTSGVSPSHSDSIGVFSVSGRYFP
ncbi:MAG: hypothetical protein BWY99_02922 [Synergistetes bacterium ADurb.BinA166]|nr:MAG: hypothetical protein BWY99_02922 [Synergistetes bacterium ADurb.BinA166]